MRKIHLFILVVFAVFAAYLGAIWNNYNTAKAGMLELAKSGQIVAARLYKERLDEWLRVKNLAIAQAARAVRDLNPKMPAEREQIRRALAVANSVGEFSSAYMGFADGDFIYFDENVSVPKAYRANEREWYKIALSAGKASLTPPYEDAFLGDFYEGKVVSITAPVGNDAAIAADLKLVDISLEISRIEKALNGLAFIADDKGGVIVSGENNNSNLNYSLARELAQNPQNSEFKFENRDFVVFAEPLESADWLFVVALDEEAIFAPLNSNLKSNLKIAFILFAFGLAAATLFAFLARRADKLEREKEENERILIQQSKIAAIGEMTAAIAHQWRQPVSALLLHASGLEREISEPRLNDALIAKKTLQIKEISRFLAGTLENFREFYKGGEEESEFDLGRAASEVVELLAAIFSARGIEAQESYEGDLRLRACQNYVKQILLNLLSNAKDAVCDSRAEGRVVALRAWRDGDFVIVSVCDNAAGVSAETAKKIFKKRLTTKGAKGTGDGLYICALLARRLGGEIWLENAGGNSNLKSNLNNLLGGAEFRLRLPIKRG